VSGIGDGPETERFALAVESADAHLQSKSGNRQEASKHVRAADAAVAPFANVAIEDIGLAYRRDLILARVRSRQRSFPDAFAMYDRAAESLAALNGSQATGETASLWMEAAAAAEAAKDDTRAGRFYGRAYRTFIALNMTESAQMIEGKVGPGDDSDPGTESASMPGPREEGSTASDQEEP
jgi:hypothetical protein